MDAGPLELTGGRSAVMVIVCRYPAALNRRSARDRGLAVQEPASQSSPFMGRERDEL